MLILAIAMLAGPTFELRGVKATSTEAEVQALGGSCDNQMCYMPLEWAPTIAERRISHRKLEFRDGKLFAMRLTVRTIGGVMLDDDRAAIRASLTKLYGKPCKIVQDDQLGAALWCFADGTLSERITGVGEITVAFIPSTPEERAEAAAETERLKKAGL